MPYRTPIVTGDRVALAPHLDLWMAGCRYGVVTNIGLADTDRDRVLFYNVRLDTGRHVTLDHDDLLGAVAGTPVGGATRSTCTCEAAKGRYSTHLPTCPAYGESV